jgi:hypothetical protein
MPAIDVLIRATPRQALDFMTRLARDDRFREQVAANPVAVLAAYNIHIVPAGARDSLADEESSDEAPAQRTEAFGDWASRCDERVRALEGVGFRHQGLLPPKHVVEEALANVSHANEFRRPGKGHFEGVDPLGFWLMFPLTGT